MTSATARKKRTSRVRDTLRVVGTGFRFGRGSRAVIVCIVIVAVLRIDGRPRGPGSRLGGVEGCNSLSRLPGGPGAHMRCGRDRARRGTMLPSAVRQILHIDMDAF